jgi:DNA-binding transcriptional MerR regulator
MDYTTTNFNQNIKYLEENLEIKRRLKDNFNISDIRSLIYNTSEDCAKVLILKKNEKTRFENTLHPHTERKTATMTKAAGKLERVLSSKPKTDRKKELSIEEFIPIRKNSVKKEPFIFGLSEKLANP